jgi:GNAT superfamily N-acetyltransferase
MPDIKLATAEDIKKLSELSVRLGNIPLFPGQSIVSFFEDGEGVAGFAAVQSAWHAAGSWVKEEYRRLGFSYELRSALDNELRRRGIQVYFALPGNEFEKMLFAKYGHVLEQTVQVRHL